VRVPLLVLSRNRNLPTLSVYTSNLGDRWTGGGLAFVAPAETPASHGRASSSSRRGFQNSVTSEFSPVHESAVKRLTPRARRKADPIRGVPQFERNSFPSSCRRAGEVNKRPCHRKHRYAITLGNAQQLIERRL
jgi:hypothetical protein